MQYKTLNCFLWWYREILCTLHCGRKTCIFIMIILPSNVHQPHHPLFQIYEQKEWTETLLNGSLIETWLTLQDPFSVTDVTSWLTLHISFRSHGTLIQYRWLKGWFLGLPWQEVRKLWMTLLSTLRFFYTYKKCCFCVTDVTRARHFPMNSISLSKLCVDCL